MMSDAMKTFLDWSSYKDAGMGDAYADIPKQGGDFAKAVAVCINSRQCETKGKGVMCPSYRVTDNPLLSTGGRVRLLKAALNGELGKEPFNDPKLVEAMALCLGCKGCKRECENSVDMAQIKIEYLAQQNATQGVSLRTRLFAHTPRWLHRLPWLKNLVVLCNRYRWLALLTERLLGITATRRLPEAREEGFCYDEASRAEENPDDYDATKEVVLFIDTFNHHYTPQIAHAAIDVLQAGGYRVHFASPGATTEEAERPLCCGRSFLAHGMVDEAKEEARRTLEVLLPYAQAGTTIVGLEPACLLAIRDDYLALGLGEAAETVSAQAILFEEFIAREVKAKRMELPLAPLSDKQKLLVHGHCHQKAVGAMKSMRRVLKLIPELEFEMIEASCCGMGGSFGLEREHAEIATAMAEDSLLPTIRANGEATLLANGFSCREQIAAGSGRKAEHLAEILQRALG
jgi:glycerol-3-phosphate dehydrogenase subunit C